MWKGCRKEIGGGGRAWLENGRKTYRRRREGGGGGVARALNERKCGNTKLN